MTPKETVEAMYDAFRQGNIPFILNHLASDVRWVQPTSVPWGGEFHGPGEVGAFFRKLDDVVETTGFEIEESIEAPPDQVISYGFYSSRNRSTNKDSRTRFVFRWQFQNGQVKDYEAVMDSAPVAAAARS